MRLSRFARWRGHWVLKHILASVPLTALVFFALAANTATAYDPWWAQTHKDTQLWSGPDQGAIVFGQLPRFSYLLVSAPQQGSRLYVLNPATNGYAYVDASAVGPSLPPPTVTPTTVPSAATAVPAVTPTPSAAPPPAPQPPASSTEQTMRPLRTPPHLAADFSPWWVANFEETKLYNGSDPDAVSLGVMPQFRKFMVVEPQVSDRLKVWYPELDVFGYINADEVGPSGPSIWLDVNLARIVKDIDTPGRASGNKAYIRNLPVFDDETELKHLPNNTPVFVKQQVETADGTEWFLLDDNQFILAKDVRLPTPVSETLPGRWIDAELDEPTMVTAYEGDKIVYTALAIRGVGGTPTRKGRFEILRRVADETMDSNTIGIPRDGPGGYLLKGVLYTQYFTSDGASFHYNYWFGVFGAAGSHGCLGLNLEDSKWLWDWAEVGTPVVIR